MCLPPTGIVQAKPVTPQPPSASGERNCQGPSGRRSVRERRIASMRAASLMELVFMVRRNLVLPLGVASFTAGAHRRGRRG